MDHSWKLPGTKYGVLMEIMWQLYALGLVKTIF